MIYCAMCEAALMERTLMKHSVLLCPLCGAIFESTGENTYRLVGTTGGNQLMRELLDITDEGDEQNETMAFKADTFT